VIGRSKLAPRRSDFGLGIVYRSSRFTLATPKPIVHNLPFAGEPREMLCLDFATRDHLRVLGAPHLWRRHSRERLEQTSTIKQIVTPFISAGRTVIIGADLKRHARKPLR
jgi:hypothetical protein